MRHARGHLVSVPRCCAVQGRSVETLKSTRNSCESTWRSICDMCYRPELYRPSATTPYPLFLGFGSLSSAPATGTKATMAKAKTMLQDA